MIYEVYFSTLNPHLKVWDNYPLLPTIIFSFPTTIQVKVNLSGEYFIFIDETQLVGMEVILTGMVSWALFCDLAHKVISPYKIAFIWISK